jgi:hypothetical protein
VFLPFDWKGMSLFIIAILARRDNVVLCRFPSPDKGHNVVHCQFTGRGQLTAVITLAFRTLLVPPLGLPEVSGLLFFFSDILIRSWRNKITHSLLFLDAGFFDNNGKFITAAEVFIFVKSPFCGYNVADRGNIL